MSNFTNQSLLEQRVQRFVKCNAVIREATLQSEQAFLKLAGHISAAQLQIILVIGENSPCSMNYLAKTLHFSQANITQMANRLISKKFLKRTRSKTDKRVVHVSLLTKGQKVYDLNRAHVERMARSWFSKMTEKEQEILLTIWEKYLA